VLAVLAVGYNGFVASSKTAANNAARGHTGAYTYCQKLTEAMATLPPVAEQPPAATRSQARVDYGYAIKAVGQTATSEGRPQVAAFMDSISVIYLYKGRGLQSQYDAVQAAAKVATPVITKDCGAAALK